jgi:hypothetical protein
VLGLRIWWGVRKRRVGLKFFFDIYGLPGDNYDQWFEWIEKLGKLRSQFPRALYGDIRFEFSITNFEPCRGTPFANMPQVDFKEKTRFLKDWIKVLHQEEFCKADQLSYRNAKGRLGRMKDSYQMLMRIKRSGPEILEPLSRIFPRGIGRSIPSSKARRFLESCS